MFAGALPTPSAAASHDLLVAVQRRFQALQQASARGEAPPSLQGRFIGLVCSQADSPEAQLFRRAAAGLGARVALVRPGLGSDSPAADVATTARMLGRLYDALECQGLDPALVAQLASAAGVPVFDGLAGEAHPTARLAHPPAAQAPRAADEAAAGCDCCDTPSAEARLQVLQAALLVALG